MSKRLWIIPLVVLLVAARLLFAIAGHWTEWEGHRAEQRTDDAYLRADMTPLSTRISGTVRKVNCVILIHRCVQQKPLRHAWTEEEIDEVREFLVVNPIEVVARKVGRSTSSVKHLCSRRGIRVKELRCDLFSINSLAAAMHVRKAEIVFLDRSGLARSHEGRAGENRCLLDLS
jgi:hypothetical protein